MKKMRFCNAAAAVAALLLAAACERAADNESIVAKVFMPQTSVNGGMVYNEYEVPVKNDPDARHHILDAESNTLRVILGVKQSGTDARAFSVTVSDDRAYSESVLPTIAGGMLLPEEVYSLPSSADVAEGETEAVFFMDVDLDKLVASYSDLFSKKFVVTAAISNPTRFELNKSRNRTVVIINGRTFIPQQIQVSMPQASMLNGGVTNHYPVPFDDTMQNYTYDEASGRLSIPLGVTRNGEEPFNAFTVDVAIDQTYAAGQLSSIPDGVLLPEGTYSLSTDMASVREGQTDASFELLVDMGKLIEEYPDLSKSQLVAAVTIDNPTLYELNTDMSCTVVMINARSFYPVPEAPNLLLGGEFNDGDEEYWTGVNSDGGGGKGTGFKPELASIRDGVLRFTINGERCFHSFYQKVTIPDDQTGRYKVSVYFRNNVATDASGRVFFDFSSNHPHEDVSYDSEKGDCYVKFEAAMPQFEGSFFDMSLQATGSNIDKSTGIINIDKGGDYYFILGVDRWGNTLDAWFDNAKLQKIEE